MPTDPQTERPQRPRCRTQRVSQGRQAEDVAEGGLNGVGPVVVAHGPGEEGEGVAVAGARPPHAAADAPHPEALVVDAEPQTPGPLRAAHDAVYPSGLG